MKEPDRTATLFCVPHAGGTAGVDFAEAVRDLARQIREAAPPGGWALLGHSMGGLLAYEVARNHRALGLARPERLLLSACPGPRWHSAAEPEAGWGSDRDIAERLVELGGLPREVAADADAAAYFTGLVRQDARLLTGYRYDPAGEPLGFPLALFLGSADPLTDEGTAAEWQEAAGAAHRRRGALPGHGAPRGDGAHAERGTERGTGGQGPGRES